MDALQAAGEEIDRLGKIADMCVLCQNLMGGRVRCEQEFPGRGQGVWSPGAASQSALICAIDCCQLSLAARGACKACWDAYTRAP